MNLENNKIAIIGLGYVGLPLAIEFGKKYDVLGFDIDEKRVSDLKNGFDITKETSPEDIFSSKMIKFSCTKEELRACNIFIVTVPTPIDNFKVPDLRPLLKASTMIGSVLKKGDIVIYESTVYPGCTEEDCVPALEKSSGLVFNRDFFCGYSPERINPGDKINTLTKIVKVTSGSTPEVADLVDELYKSVILAGTHKAPSLKVAEASKAIENAQRDVNISFVNELALIFDRMGIDTSDVLEAAGTKWNFLKYRPGLVGGHCIGVDPYYLAYKAEALGYTPQVILSGRRVNDTIATFISYKVIKLLIKNGHNVGKSNALILGITFKEDSTDIRNTKIVDIHRELSELGVTVDIFDPNANQKDVLHEYGIHLLDKIEKKYEAVILAVSHKTFQDINYENLKKDKQSVIFDIKSFLPREIVDGRL